MKAVRIQVLAICAVAFVLGRSAFGQQGEAERLIAEGEKLAWLKNWQQRSHSSRRQKSCSESAATSAMSCTPGSAACEASCQAAGFLRPQRIWRPFWTTRSQKMTLAYGFDALP